MFRSFVVTTLMAVATSVAATSLPNRPVATLDLSRYVGQWHEIGHLPMFFQRRCVDRITATYTEKADGTRRVKDGSMDVADGVARKVAGQPGALQVRFAPAWLSWLPMVWADYWVVDRDADYQWAVVGGPNRKYLWVLSRTPGMSRTLFDQIKERARQRGYPVDRLVMAAPLD